MKVAYRKETRRREMMGRDIGDLEERVKMIVGWSSWIHDREKRRENDGKMGKTEGEERLESGRAAGIIRRRRRKRGDGEQG